MHKIKLLFVHVPKTGGTSITRALEAHFGNRLHRDHDGPTNPGAPMNMDPDGFLQRHHSSEYNYLDGKDAITGHIWIKKYDPIRADIRATILRHPVERAISHYFFWMSPKCTNVHPVRTYMLNTQPSFMQFARFPTVRWFYSRYAFRETEKNSFDYIGDYADLGSDWCRVMRGLGLQAQEIRANETRNYSADYGMQRSAILGDPSKMSMLQDIFAEDIDFYERWTRNRDS